MEEKSDQGLMEKLDMVRGKIAELKNEGLRVESLRPPVEVVIAAKEKDIDSILEMLADPEYKLARADLPLLFIATFANELKKNLSKHMRETWPKETASGEQKVARTAVLDQEILKLEVAEEKMICDLEVEGVSITRRGDLSPKVFFEMVENESTLSDNVRGSRTIRG